MSIEGQTVVAAFIVAAVIVAVLVVVAQFVAAWLASWIRRVRWHRLPRISGGAHDPIEMVHLRLDDVLDALTTIRADILRRPAGALPIGTAPIKPHRHQFRFTSEERTNKVLRRIYTCRLDDCPDTYIEEEREPVLTGVRD